MITSKSISKAVFPAAFLLPFFIPSDVYAMHIMEGYLSPGWSVFWTLVSFPFAVWGFLVIKKILSESPKALLLLALCGAFAFVLSALKLPSVTGSCSHPTGAGLGAVIFGPAPMALIGVIILLFQALLLAHGGLTTLGANVFSMAVAGPLAAYAVFKFCRRAGVAPAVAVFAAAFTGDLFTYVVASGQLAAAYPSPLGGFVSSFAEFAGIFALTQIPLAVSEGLLTVVVYNVLSKYGSKEPEAFKAV